MSSSEIPQMSHNNRTIPLGSMVKRFFLYEPKVGEKIPRVMFFKHRYFRAVAYMVVVLCTTLLYYGWQQFSMMLFRDGVYGWECEGMIVEEDKPCLAQDTKVQTLFTVALSSEFVIGVLAGLCLDHFGPLLTGIIGHSMFFLGLICLMYSSQSAQLYIPGMVLLGGAVNMVAFPSLILGDFFPTKSGLMMSLVVAAQTAGTVASPVLKSIWDTHPSMTFRDLFWGYIGCIVLPCAIVYALTLPAKRPSWAAEIAEADAQKEAVAENNGRVRADSHCVSQHGSVIGLETEDVGRSTTEKSVRAPPVDVNISAEAVRSLSFVKQIMTPEYILFTLYYIIQLFQFGYYPTTVQKEFGEDVASFQGYILPTQAVFGAVFGALVDITKTIPICAFLVLMMSLAYIFALIPNVGLQYGTSVLYVISNSYIYTVKYTYAAELFPSDHFGVLIGLIGCVAGALTLLNIVVQNADDYRGTSIAYASAGIVCLAILGYLYVRQKKGINYKEGAPQHLREQLEDEEEDKDQKMAV